MARPSLALLLRRLRGVAHPEGAAPSDGQLLERFAARRDEVAFEALLERHGPMVWNVCRRVLANPSDADDAFQATFLVLVRKATSIARQGSVGSWLHGVARRVSLDALARAARQRERERKRAAQAPPPEAPAAEVRAVIDEELGRLPEKYRAPVVLCYLEGKTNDEAALLLGWSRGTVAGRLSRARDLLRGRLARRGLALTPTALAAILVEGAAVSAALPPGPSRAVLSFATGKGSASPQAVALAEGATHAMFVNRLKITAALLAALVLTGTGAAWLLHAALAGPAPEEARARPARPAPLVLANDPAQARRDRPELVKGNTAFALALHARLRERGGNVVASPYSVSTALAMTAAGARGRTAEQMAEVLRFTLPPERLHPAAGALARDLGGAGAKRPYQLHVANALWGQKDYGFRKDYLALTRSCYDAGLTEVDFVGDREAARATINAWVEKQTRDKIKELVGKDHLTGDTRLVLTNAIYLKAEWVTKFDKDGTRQAPFHVSAKSRVKVAMMFRKARFGYLEGDGLQALELPLAGQELSMLVLLPKKVDGLAALEKGLTAERLAGLPGKMRQAEVRVSLPRFKVASTFALKDTLTAMGMGLPFSGGADFSGMTDGGGLAISEVAHKTYVDVNESGLEATGATAVMMFKSDDGERVEVFNADRPFLFVVRDNRSGSVLFLGRVVDPRG
jgi:serpin B